MSGWQYADVWDVVADVRGDAPALVHGDRRVSWTAFRDHAASFERTARRGGRAPAVAPGPVGVLGRVLL